MRITKAGSTINEKSLFCRWHYSSQFINSVTKRLQKSGHQVPFPSNCFSTDVGRYRSEIDNGLWCNSSPAAHEYSHSPIDATSQKRTSGGKDHKNPVRVSTKEARVTGSITNPKRVLDTLPGPEEDEGERSENTAYLPESSESVISPLDLLPENPSVAFNSVHASGNDEGRYGNNNTTSDTIENEQLVASSGVQKLQLLFRDDNRRDENVSAIKSLEEPSDGLQKLKSLLAQAVRVTESPITECKRYSISTGTLNGLEKLRALMRESHSIRDRDEDEHFSSGGFEVPSHGLMKLKAFLKHPRALMSSGSAAAHNMGRDSPVDLSPIDGIHKLQSLLYHHTSDDTRRGRKMQSSCTFESSLGVKKLKLFLSNERLDRG
jgi:hypothetical protein